MFGRTGGKRRGEPPSPTPLFLLAAVTLCLAPFLAGGTRRLPERPAPAAQGPGGRRTDFRIEAFDPPGPGSTYGGPRPDSPRSWETADAPRRRRRQETPPPQEAPPAAPPQETPAPAQETPPTAAEAPQEAAPQPEESEESDFDVPFLHPFGEDTTLVPIPSLAFSENEGGSYGLMLALLFGTPDSSVDRVLAVRGDYNNDLGFTGAVDYFGFMSVHESFELYGSLSQNIERTFQATYTNRRFLEGDYTLKVDAKHSASATDRFFGFGPDSDEDAESNYTTEETRFLGSFGIHPSEEWSVGYRTRYRHVRILEGVLGTESEIAQLGDSFPGLNGISGGDATAHGLFAEYDTRDVAATPTRGLYASAFGEAAHVYNRGHDGWDSPIYHGGLEASAFLPAGDEARFVTVLHSRWEFTWGHDPVFWELSGLGGKRSLRAFGSDRFLDRHSWTFNVEERIRLYSLTISGVRCDLEAAPFIDIGQVYGGSDGPFDDTQVNYGIGGRVVVRPHIVGRLDIAWGDEGSGLYLGLDYPW